ncbi:MAG: class I SAM-dependent methyltransferase [Phycisphaeraceae bacterium]|nr:class I SAM-dependent methyltransferase [Phycisphaeraceae bacterium]
MPQSTKRSPTRPAASRRRARRPLTARTADRYDLYQRAVQCPEAEVAFAARAYRRAVGRAPRVLREDFCGCFATACEWARHSKDHIAVGLDLDPEPIAWGRKHNLPRLTPEQQSRVHISRGNVLTPPRSPRPDIVLATNFSYWTFKTRDLLLRYFRSVRASLAADGVFILDFFGGSDVLRELTETTRHGQWSYLWQQERYDPVTGDYICHIHFKFKNGSMLRRAFTYHWRVWTIPELKDLLAEAGLPNVTVYCEGEDAKGEGNGVFRPVKQAPADRCFIAYLVATR